MTVLALFCNAMLSTPLRRLSPILLLMLVCPAVFAQSEQSIVAGSITGGKNVSIPRIEADVSIDGVLDDAVWSRAVLVDDFHQINPFEYTEPSQRTEVRLFYDENALYVGVRLFEDDPSLISTNVMRQGQGLQPDDTFNLLLDPYLDRRNGYLFEVNANGVRVDGIYQNVSEIESSWEGIWQAQSNIDDQGWTTEIRMPFQTLSFDPANTEWGINFRRTIRRNNEDIGWISRNRQMDPSIAGTATELEGLQQGVGLDVVPYMVMRQQKVFDPQGYTEQVLEPQLDMFYKVTPQLNAALTINTDFSATEVDDRQVNLTRFSLFFPERRDFFLRDADIFEFGRIGSGAGFNGNDAIPGAAVQNGRPFFSRRIGLSSRGAPVDINAGAKLSGRVGDWNLGSLVVSQEEDPETGVDAQDVFIGRAALNMLSQSQLGVIATYGDPQSNLDNRVLGADFRYQNSNLPGGRSVLGEAWYQESDREGVDGENASYGFGFFFPNNQGWRGLGNYKRIEANFDPAVGFVNQRGIEDFGLSVGYRHFLEPGGFFRNVFAGIDTYRNQNLYTGDAISESLSVRLTTVGNFGDNSALRLIRDREVLRTPFNIFRSSDGEKVITLAPGDYRFTNFNWNTRFADQRVISGGINVNGGEYYRGTRFQGTLNLIWRPSPRYNFSTVYSENHIRLPEGDFTVRQTTLRTLFNFSSALSWISQLQYENVSEFIGFNSRLQYIPQAGRQIFLVLNYGLEDFDKDNNFNSVNADLTLKFNYTFRF